VDLLTIYVDAWYDTGRRVVSLCRELGAEEWARPTDCSSWSVRDVVAHLAAVESELAGGSRGVPAGGVTEVSPAYTQGGVDARADLAPHQLVDELESAVEDRVTRLRDADWSQPPVAPAGLAWDWDTLLRNRVIDMWVHEQDIRRAVGRPGGLDSPGARVTTTAFAMGMPFVLGKRVAPGAGTAVVWEVDGPAAVTIAAQVGEDGRAVAVDPPPGDADAWLGMDTETFAMVCAGRRDPSSLDVAVRGDEGLAARVLAAMPITP
jgi:uncharacterized protein (TIGR03083 family)